MQVESQEFACPWCGVPNTIEFEPAERGHELVEDCRLCCCPIEISLPGAEGGVVQVRREGE